MWIIFLFYFFLFLSLSSFICHSIFSLRYILLIRRFHVECSQSITHQIVLHTCTHIGTFRIRIVLIVCLIQSEWRYLKRNRSYASGFDWYHLRFKRSMPRINAALTNAQFQIEWNTSTSYTTAFSFGSSQKNLIFITFVLWRQKF